MLYQSNLIESELSGQALFDAIRAWDYLSDKSELNVDDVLLVHYNLMENLNPRIAGRFRNIQVSVGGRLGANPNDVSGLISELLKIVPKNWENVKQWHIDFEHIHPFEDGNGRVGRIILLWHLLKNKLPVQVIYNRDVEEYYEWF